jgi:hypothetical protein
MNDLEGTDIGSASLASARGLGAALAPRFVEGFKLVARSPEVIARTARRDSHQAGLHYRCRLIRRSRSKSQGVPADSSTLGLVEILGHDSARRLFGRLIEIGPEIFEDAWRSWSLPVVAAARAGDARAGRRSILITSATGVCDLSRVRFFLVPVLYIQALAGSK